MKPNSKFMRGTPAYERRREKLAKIAHRIGRGESFDDLQGYDETDQRKMYPRKRSE